MSSAVRLCCALIILLLGTGSPSAAQTPDAASPSASSAAAPLPPIAVPLSQVATEAELALTSLRSASTPDTDDTLKKIAEEIPSLARELDLRQTDTAQALKGTPSLETLRELQAAWGAAASSLESRATQLSRRVTQLELEVKRITDLEVRWQKTREAAKAAEVPAEIPQQISAVLQAAKAARESLEQQRAEALALQSRVARQSARIVESQEVIDSAREDAVHELLVRDSLPIWRSAWRLNAAQEASADAQNTFDAQVLALAGYVERRGTTLAIHTLIFLGLVGIFRWARSRARKWTGEDAALASATEIFETPVAIAVIVSLLLSSSLYPEAPRLLKAIIGACALIPTTLLLRRILEPRWRPALYTLTAFFFVDQLRLIAAGFPFAARLLFMGEMLAGMILVAWLYQTGKLQLGSQSARAPLKAVITVGVRLAPFLMGLAFLGATFGYVTASVLLGSVVLGSFYMLLVLYASLRILDGIVFFWFRVPPLGMFRVVRHHSYLIRQRLLRAAHWGAVIFWVSWLLDRLAIREQFLGSVYSGLRAELKVGSIGITLESVLAFGITVWVTFLFSRFIRFLLEEEVYARVSFSRGLPYAISTVLHYAVLLFGFFLALAALGVDMTKFTVLVGAFGVGLGFGLQNIINNFFSGLIVLFERPVRVGDIIQMDDVQGVVERIGIRASFIRTVHGSEVIIPNAKLISERVTNWTFSNRLRAIEIPASVAPGSDPDRVMAVLQAAAAGHPLIARSPEPEVIATKFSATALSFELRAFTDSFAEWGRIQSDLTLAIHGALRREKIELA